MSDIQSTEVQTEVPADTSAPQVYQPEMLNHNDIINAQRIIELSMERGTFKAKELIEVSAVYARLTAFVESLPTDVRGQ